MYSRENEFAQIHIHSVRREEINFQRISVSFLIVIYDVFKKNLYEKKSTFSSDRDSLCQLYPAFYFYIYSFSAEKFNEFNWTFDIHVADWYVLGLCVIELS